MGNPDGTAVNYAALLNDAKTWEQQQHVLSEARAKIQSLHVDFVQFGQLFAPLHGVYNQITDRLASADGEGAGATGHIAQSLRWTVDKYRGVDHESGHDIENAPGLNIPY